MKILSGRTYCMEARRRVKEQQKRIGAVEFRNTHFSYVMGTDGVEKFVSTPELQSESSIGNDPLEPGQVWTISPGCGEDYPGLYRIEINEGPGSGVKILNKPVPPAFKESMAMLSKTFMPVQCNWSGIRNRVTMNFPSSSAPLTHQSPVQASAWRLLLRSVQPF